MENNKNPLRTLYIVQLITIIILVLLLIQNVLPLFGIAPAGQQNKPIQLPPNSGGYISPANQQARAIDSASLVLALNPQIIVQNV